ncbi:MAG: DNA (cytosine-5-)-methyltransferase [Desulfobacteraceae bacterium]|nr:DNA (cytosine-5-)-methyltransferase [Desulfobacteraceae bacterium]
MNPLTVGSLFAGIGGLDFGLERAGMRVKWQVEYDPTCISLRGCKIKKERGGCLGCEQYRSVPWDEQYNIKVLEKHWPEVKRYGDIKEIKSGELEKVDLICGGFPCQDISTAGRGKGITGERSSLWFEMLRVICMVRPRYVLVENVSMLRHRGLNTVLAGLAESGYHAEWDCIPASSVGANHQRDRIYVMGYTRSCGRGGKPRRRTGQIPENGHPQLETENVSNADGLGCQRSDVSHRPRQKGAVPAIECQGDAAHTRQRCRQDEHQQPKSANQNRQQERQSKRNRSNADSVQNDIGRYGDCQLFVHGPQEAGGLYESWQRWWATEPNVDRVAHGIPKRVDRLKCLGNAVVPQVAEYLGRLIMTHHLRGLRP